MQQVCFLLNKDDGKDGIFKSVLNYDYSTWGDQMLWDLDFLKPIFRILWTIYWDGSDRVYCEYYFKEYLSNFNYCTPMRKDIVIVKDLTWSGRHKIFGFFKNYCNMLGENNSNL